MYFCNVFAGTTVVFSFVAASIVWLRAAGCHTPNFITALQYVIHLFRHTQIYGDVSERGVPYLVSSVVAMLLVNGSVFALLERWHLSPLTGPRPLLLHHPPRHALAALVRPLVPAPSPMMMC